MTLRQAPTRKVILVVAVLAAFAVAGIVLTAAWMGALTVVGITPAEDLKIADVQFSKGFLTVTVKNAGDTRYDWDVVTVTEVMVQPLQSLPDAIPTSAPYEVPMNIPVHLGDQASIAVGYDWIPGKTYMIKVTSSHGNYWSIKAVAP
jgi:hypothetical protein